MRLSRGGVLFVETSSLSPTMDVASVDELVNLFRAHLIGQDESLHSLIRPLDRTLLASIKPRLSHLSFDQIETTVQKLIPDDRTISDFITNYFNYISLVALADEHVKQPLLHKPPKTPVDHAANFDLLLGVYNPAVNIFRRPDAAFFTQSMQVLSQALVCLAITADHNKKSNKNEKASEAARQMTTTLGIACIDRSAEEPNKRRAAFSLANGLFKIYFFLNNMRLCDTVVKNTSVVVHQLETHYPRSEMVTFHYYLGRLALYQRRLHQARASLKKAFNLCKADHWKNRRLIFIYLTAASLPLGFLPRMSLLEHFSLSEQFRGVIEKLRIGYWPDLKASLDCQKEWFRFKGIYMLLREKLEVICWRNFFVIAAGMRNGSQGVKLSLAHLVVPARQLFMEPSIDEDDIVCMASSLIDQGYLKAYVKLGEAIVFGAGLPRISTVGEHMNDGNPTDAKVLKPNAITHTTSALMSAQSSSNSVGKLESDVKASHLAHRKIRGAMKAKSFKRQ